MQGIETRRLIARGMAQQWFGGLMRPATAADGWLLEGLAGWAEDHYLRTFMGANELAYRCSAIILTAYVTTRMLVTWDRPVRSLTGFWRACELSTSSVAIVLPGKPRSGRRSSRRTTAPRRPCLSAGPPCRGATSAAPRPSCRRDCGRYAACTRVAEAGSIRRLRHCCMA